MRISKDPQVRKREILAAAGKLFEKYGIDKTSMSDVAKEADITKGLVYYYFKSKEELIEEAVKNFVFESELALKNIIQADTMNFYSKLSEMLRLYFLTISKNLSINALAKTNPGVYELVKRSLCRSALDLAGVLIDEGVMNGNISISHPRHVLSILIGGIADLYSQGVQDPKIFAEIIEQTLHLPKGSIKI
ncbi:MAG TPA: hypothetical protein DCG38_04215 [Eubacteriaceae bacterium]|jgi:AcrR family transcriptional regulator|nr:hypothetical protein [Eubacteriaceae bacterium]